MAEEAKVDPKVAKGAVIGAAGCLFSERNYNAESNLREAIRAAEKSGVSRADLEKLVGASVLQKISPYYPEEKSSPVAYAPSGLTAVLSKVASVDQRVFLAGMFHAIKEGAKLTTEARKELPKGDFALGKGRYPIEDKSHARNALARVSQHGSPSEVARVRAKVHQKYPDIGKK